MGMSSGGNKGGMHSEINVTPLIDVLLVLLIIFLVVMPIMMKMETLQIPRNITDNEMPDPNSTMITIKVKVSGDMVFDENGKETSIQSTDLLKLLRPKLEAQKIGSEKVVFVDFEDECPWSQVITTMDTVRSLATDLNRDEIKVALKVKDDPAAAGAK